MKELNEIVIPENLKYSDDHEWIAAAAPFRVGISDFAQSQLGDITFVEMPEVGASFAKGDEFGTLESTKSVSPLMMPLTCKVVAVNDALSDDPGLLNGDPYGQGWIVEVEPVDAGQLGELFDAAAYRKLIETSGGE
jgi:glycine cleavage system H protein